MSFGLTAVQLGTIAAGMSAAGGLGSVIGGFFQGNAAKDAARIQSNADQKGIDELTRLLQPYTQAGQGALSAQQDLLGLNGNGAQQASVDAIQNSPLFQALNQQGQNAILQNASATGMLRSGGTDVTLSQSAPQLLMQLMQQRFQNLGSLSSLGAGTAGQLGGSLAQLFGDQGAAQAGGVLGQTNAMVNGINTGIGSILGTATGLAGNLGNLRQQDNVNAILQQYLKNMTTPQAAQ